MIKNVYMATAASGSLRNNLFPTCGDGEGKLETKKMAGTI